MNKNDKRPIIQANGYNGSEPTRVCPKCGKPTRVGYKIEDDKKVRVCKKCGTKIK